MQGRGAQFVILLLEVNAGEGGTIIHSSSGDKCRGGEHKRYSSSEGLMQGRGAQFVILLLEVNTGEGSTICHSSPGGKCRGGERNLSFLFWM